MHGADRQIASLVAPKKQKLRRICLKYEQFVILENEAKLFRKIITKTSFGSRTRSVAWRRSVIIQYVFKLWS